MTDHSESSTPKTRALVALAVLAPVLGGSTQLWARATLLLATAAVLLVWPPRRLPGAVWLALGGGILALALAAFLPASWFSPMHWRELLTNPLELALPATRTAQPWLTIEALGLLVAGLSFAAAVIAVPWRSSQRREVVRLYVVGMVALAVLAIVALAAKWPVPWWPRPGNSGIGFGFFPNRNQTANVLALAGIMAAALGWESLNRHKRGGYFWFGGLAILGVALVIAYSRAGIAIFLAGTLLWVLMSLRFSSSKKGGTLALAAVLVLLAGFFLFGGDTLKRFQQQGSVAGDFRMSIQRDAWALAAERPWLGQGLGNFEAVFGMTRPPSSHQARAIHPESDWLWVAVEMGWPATLLLALALALWAWRTLPFESGSDRYLRSAAAVCGLCFAVHGLLDVSGHRAGSVWPALLLFGLAVHPNHHGAESRWAPPFFRLCGVVLAAFGGWWLISVIWPAATLRMPTSGTLAYLETRLEGENAAAEPAAAIASADAALRIAPLRWQLYYQRAVAHAALPGGEETALLDFERARFLEPRWAEHCMAEGRLWLALDQPRLALEAWIEALRRAGPEAPGLFTQMVASGWNRMELRAGLAELALGNPEFLHHYLDRTDPLEFSSLAHRLLERDPNLDKLDARQRQALFQVWYRRGDKDELMALMVAHPQWLEDAWMWVADHYARKKDYERAWRFIERYATPPVLPKLGGGQSVAEAEREFHFHPDDIQQGLALYSALRNLRQTDEALTTLRAVEAIPGSPAYVLWLEAELWAGKGEWEKAWQAWQRYLAAAKP